MKRILTEMKQLNLMILVPVLALGDRYSGLAQKILARYGLTRQTGNFPALIFRYYLGLLAEASPGENPAGPEVIKGAGDRFNIYNYIINRADRINPPSNTGSVKSAQGPVPSIPGVIKSAGGRFDIYHYITNEAGRTNQLPHTGSTEHHAPNIYNHYSDNRTSRTSQAFHVHKAEYAPVLFNTENAWMTYVQKKYLTHVTQYVPWHNVFHFVTRQENSAEASQLSGPILALKRETQEWREQSVQEHNNPIEAPVSGRTPIPHVPEYLPLQEKAASYKSPLPGIQLACFIHNIGSINLNTLFNTSPGVSLNHLDMKPVLQNSAEKKQADPDKQAFTVPHQRTEFVRGADTGRAGSVTERKYIEQKAHLLKPGAAKIQPVVLTIYNRYKNLQEFFIRQDNVWAKTREEHDPGASSPAANAGEERVTVKRREIIGKDSLILNKRAIEEAYDVQEAQPTKQTPVQGKEEGFAAPGIQEKTQGVPNLVTDSSGKGRMDSNRLWAMVAARNNLTAKNNVAAITDYRAIREFKPALIEREENQGGKTLPDHGVKLHFNSEAGVETYRIATENQVEAGEPPRDSRAVRQGRLIFRKPNPIPREAASGAEQVFQEAPPREKKGDSRTVIAQKQVQSIKDIGVEEINLLAERVFKVLEKRISIQKDRRGLL